MNVNFNRKTVLAMCCAVLPMSVMAHTASPYLLPEVFDSKAANITLQSAITVEKFYVPSRNFKTDYVVTRPDGTQQPFQAAASLSRMNVAEVELPLEGTYRIRTANGVGNSTEYALVDGKWLRIRAPRPNAAMPNAAPKPETAKSDTAKPETAKPEASKVEPPRFLTPDQVPATAKRITTVSNLLAETFVSKVKPSNVPAPTGKGLELQFTSHPNQVFVGDELKAQVIFNGQPVPNLEVDVFKGAGSYDLNSKRDQPHVKTDSKGEFAIKLAAAGIYLITFAYPEASRDATQAPPAQTYTYGLTFEVTE